MEEVKEGALEKHNKKSEWVPYQVVLKQRSLELYSSNSKEKKKPNTTITAHLSYIQSNSKLSSTGFIVRNEKGKDFVLRAKDKKEKAEWIKALKSAGMKEASFTSANRHSFDNESMDSFLNLKSEEVKR